MIQPKYRVIVRDFGANFGPGNVIAEFENAKNIGWGTYLNDVPEAYFTINQEDPKLQLIRGYEGKSHVQIYRDSDLVFGGWLMEHDATAEDAVFYCYGYLGGLFWLHTDWDQKWPLSTITKKAKSGTTVTLTTSEDHGMIAGDKIFIELNGTDAEFPEGAQTVLAAPTTTTFTYTTGTSATVAETTLTGVNRVQFQVVQIINDLWTRAKTTLANSNMAWVTTGTIEAPVTESDGAIPLALPDYKTYYKRILFVFKDLAAFSVSDTTNIVSFEVTPSGTFNFWKDRGVDRTSTVQFRYGDNKISSFGDTSQPVEYRNTIIAAGSQPFEITGRTTSEDATGQTEYGRREETIYLQYVRTDTELQRIADLRLSRAKRILPTIYLNTHLNSFTPPGATGAAFNIGDTVKVDIDWGITNVDGPYLVTGVKVIVQRGTERVRLLLQERPGA